MLQWQALRKSLCRERPPGRAAPQVLLASSLVLRPLEKGDRSVELTAQTLPGQVSDDQMPMRTAIQTPIATIIRFSLSDTKPSGTLLVPPTQAHFSSLLST